MRSLRWAALLLIALAATAHATPALTTLSTVRPTELIRVFNAEASHARLVVMLSPT